MNPCIYGFRVLGDKFGERVSLEARRALNLYAECDSRCELHRESYLSAFWFTAEYRDYLHSKWSDAGYSGTCYSPAIYFDCDCKDNPERARKDTAKLALYLSDRFTLSEDDIVIHFSGSKGYGLALPTYWHPAPSDTYNVTAKAFALSMARAADVGTMDQSIYNQTRLWRGYNSRHPSTGLHKVRLSLDTLMKLDTDAIAMMARNPVPFSWPWPEAVRGNGQAGIDWTTTHNEAATVARGPVSGTRTTLNRGTLDFIRWGASEGDRHRLLFSAAANLSEFRCPKELAKALLAPAAHAAGLPQDDIDHAIECGLARGVCNDTRH